MTRPREHTQVLFSALDVAMQAKSGQLDPQDVEELQARAEQVLGGDHQVTRAVNQFATQHQLFAHDWARMAELGDELHRLVQVEAMPDPVDADRRDIHG